VTISNEYLHYVLEQLAGLGRVSSRRMFGGAGLYCGDCFFGLISGDTLYFKVDDSTRREYEIRGMAPFRPYADRPEVSMTYYEVPADALEDAETLVVWARASVAVARASTKARPAARKRKSRSASARRRKVNR